MDNRGNDYVANVSQLSCTEDGRLVAWFSGRQAQLLWLRIERNTRRRLMEISGGLEKNWKRVE